MVSRITIKNYILKFYENERDIQLAWEFVQLGIFL